jgi:hypothetical protein
VILFEARHGGGGVRAPAARIGKRRDRRSRRGDRTRAEIGSGTVIGANAGSPRCAARHAWLRHTSITNACW